MFQSSGDEKFDESKEASITKIQSSSSEDAEDPDYEESEMETVSEYLPGSSSDLLTTERLSLVLGYFGEGEVIFPLNPALNRRQQPKKETKICK